MAEFIVEKREVSLRELIEFLDFDMKAFIQLLDRNYQLHEQSVEKNNGIQDQQEFCEKEGRTQDNKKYYVDHVDQKITDEKPIATVATITQANSRLKSWENATTPDRHEGSHLAEDAPRISARQHEGFIPIR